MKSFPLTILAFISLLTSSSITLAASGGNVNVSRKNTRWDIVGDAEKNAVTISQHSPGVLRIAGGASDGGTTMINGKAFVDIAVTADVSIRLGSGNDRLTIVGASTTPVQFPGALTIEMDDGQDTVNCQYLRVGAACTINMGYGDGHAGYESVAIVGADMGSFSYSTSRGEGSNSLSMNTSVIQGGLSITGSGAANSVNLASCMIHGNVRAVMGDENSQLAITDNFSMTSDTVGGIVRITMGSGRGIGSLNSVTATRIEVFFGGYANDQLGLYSVRAGSGRFDGGIGSEDRIYGSGNVFSTAPEIVGFEKRTITWK